MTKNLIAKLTQTLDVASFLAGIGEWDMVTRRQCIIQALGAISSTGVVALHGARAAKRAIRLLSEHLDALPAPSDWE